MIVCLCLILSNVTQIGSSTYIITSIEGAEQLPQWQLPGLICELYWTVARNSCMNIVDTGVNIMDSHFMEVHRNCM